MVSRICDKLNEFAASHNAKIGRSIFDWFTDWIQFAPNLFFQAACLKEVPLLDNPCCSRWAATQPITFGISAILFSKTQEEWWSLEHTDFIGFLPLSLELKCCYTFEEVFLYSRLLVIPSWKPIWNTTWALEIAEFVWLRCSNRSIRVSQDIAMNARLHFQPQESMISHENFRKSVVSSEILTFYLGCQIGAKNRTFKFFLDYFVATAASRKDQHNIYI